MRSYEIKTYSELDKFYEENERIGYRSCGFEDFDIHNIWICELYRNKQTNEYSLFITRDSDEAWIVLTFGSGE